MIYYTVQYIGEDATSVAQDIDETIQRGLKALHVEAGGPVELVNVIPVTISIGNVYLVIMAKPYEIEESNEAINRKKCYLCGGLDEQICIVCERSVCQKCVVPDIRPGESCICLECYPITPDRVQAHRHYWKRMGIKVKSRAV